MQTCLPAISTTPMAMSDKNQAHLHAYAWQHAITLAVGKFFSSYHADFPAHIWIACWLFCAVKTEACYGHC